MAITCSLTLNAFGGLEVPDAYVRVTRAETYKVNVQTDPEKPRDERQRVMYHYDAYLNAQAREDGRNPLEHGTGGFEWDGYENILAACYAHLKGQATYAAAEDC